MKHRRLAFFVDAEAIGGHEIMAARLITAAAKIPGVEAQLLYHHPFFEQAARLCTNVSVLRRAGATGAARAGDVRPGDILSIRRTLREWAPDRLIVVQGFIEGGMRGILAGRAAGVPTLSYLALATLSSRMGARFGAVRDVLDRGLFRLPSGFITVSGEQARLIGEHTAVRTRVLQNTFAAVSGHTGENPALRHMDRSRFNVGVIGRVQFSHKNQAALIPIATRLKDAGSKVCLHVIGEGPDAGRLERLVRSRNVENHLVLHGAVPPAEVSRLLSNGLDLVLMVSNYEGMPLVVLEALAAGRRVIVPPLGFADALGIALADQVSPDDPGRVAAILEDAARTGSNRASDELRRHVLDTFSAERFATAAAALISDELGL